jgi:ferritin
MNLDKVLFKNKTYGDLLGEIYENSAKTRKQVKDLINELTNLIETPGDAQRIVPLIKEYMDVGVKNDDQLVKLATIFQRLETNKAGQSEDFNFSDLQDLLQAAEDSQKNLPSPANN